MAQQKSGWYQNTVVSDLIANRLKMFERRGDPSMKSQVSLRGLGQGPMNTEVDEEENMLQKSKIDSEKRTDRKSRYKINKGGQSNQDSNRMGGSDMIGNRDQDERVHTFSTIPSYNFRVSKPDFTHFFVALLKYFKSNHAQFHPDYRDIFLGTGIELSTVIFDDRVGQLQRGKVKKVKQYQQQQQQLMEQSIMIQEEIEEDNTEY